jgi:hypothetical protein
LVIRGQVARQSERNLRAAAKRGKASGSRAKAQQGLSLKEAETTLLRVLELPPDHPEATQLLGR